VPYCAEAGICISGRIEIAASVGVNLGQVWLFGTFAVRKIKTRKRYEYFPA
jgi:hypothetical protein